MSPPRRERSPASLPGNEAREAQPGDRIDLLEAPGELGRRVVAQAPLELGEDLALGVVAHRDDERDAEPRTILAVQAGDPALLLRREVHEPGAALLRARVHGERPGVDLLAGELRVSAQERQLIVPARPARPPPP